MVAPSYAAKRSELARSAGLGLGRRGAKDAIEGAPDVEDADLDVEAEPEAEAAKKPARRGAKKA